MKAELHRLTVNGKSAMVFPLRDHRFYRFKYSVGNFQGDYRDVDNEIAYALGGVDTVSVQWDEYDFGDVVLSSYQVQKSPDSDYEIELSFENAT